MAQSWSNVASTISEWLLVGQSQVTSQTDRPSPVALQQQIPQPPQQQALQTIPPLQQMQQQIQSPSQQMQQLLPQQQQLQQHQPFPVPAPARRSSAYAGYAQGAANAFQPPAQRQRRQTAFGSAAIRPPMFQPDWDAEAQAENFADDDDIGANAAVPADAQPEPPPPAVAPGSVEVTTRVEYSALPQGAAQDVFGLVTVQATSEAISQSQQERQPMDIVCVLDVSGSMQGDKIRSVQSAVRFVIGQADPKDRLSIVSFNSGAQRRLRLCRMDVQGKDSAVRATLQLTAGGGTNIARGLSTGIAVMEQRRQKNSVSTVLLLTDGQDYSTRPQIPALIERARATGSSVYTFGFGADHDASLLSAIAEQAQTPFSYIEDNDAICAAFAGAVGGLSSVVAQNVLLTLNHNVTLKNIHTPFTVQRNSSSQATITIPDLFAGERRDILVELSAPATGGNGGATRLLEAFAVYKDLRRNGTSMQTATSLMEAERVAEPQPEAEPDQEVSAHRERVQVTEVLRVAAAAADSGDFEQAQTSLRSAQTSLRQAKKKTRFTDALDSEVQEASVRMADRMAWERGGRAEVSDAVQMHSVQRCTNTVQSRSSRVPRASKALYSQVSQNVWQDKAKSSTLP